MASPIVVSSVAAASLTDRIGSERRGAKSLGAIGRIGLALQARTRCANQIALIRQKRAKFREIGRRHLIGNLARRRCPHDGRLALIECYRDELVPGLRIEPRAARFRKGLAIGGRFAHMLPDPISRCARQPKPPSPCHGR